MGAASAAAIEPRETVRVQTTVTPKAKMATRAADGASASRVPNAVATPFQSEPLANKYRDKTLGDVGEQGQ